MMDEGLFYDEKEVMDALEDSRRVTPHYTATSEGGVMRVKVARMGPQSEPEGGTHEFVYRASLEGETYENALDGISNARDYGYEDVALSCHTFDEVKLGKLLANAAMRDLGMGVTLIVELGALRVTTGYNLPALNGTRADIVLLGDLEFVGVAALKRLVSNVQKPRKVTIHLRADIWHTDKRIKDTQAELELAGCHKAVISRPATGGIMGESNEGSFMCVCCDTREPEGYNLPVIAVFMQDGEGKRITWMLFDMVLKKAREAGIKDLRLVFSPNVCPRWGAKVMKLASLEDGMNVTLVTSTGEEPKFTIDGQQFLSGVIEIAVNFNGEFSQNRVDGLSDYIFDVSSRHRSINIVMDLGDGISPEYLNGALEQFYQSGAKSVAIVGDYKGDYENALGALKARYRGQLDLLADPNLVAAYYVEPSGSYGLCTYNDSRLVRLGDLVDATL